MRWQTYEQAGASKRLRAESQSDDKWFENATQEMITARDWAIEIDDDDE